ncbi:MAG: hypothetical protein K6G11_04035 [Lachnospiraceae bacterium]|nr:hypothetical protein [Lachnospiraceae bacterium]
MAVLKENLSRRKTKSKTRESLLGPVKFFFKGFIKYVIILWLFYKNILVIPVAVIISIINIKNEVKKDIQDKKWNLTIEFKDGLQGIQAALSAGYSIENSFSEAIKDLELIYGDKSKLKPYFYKIENSQKNNIPIEETLVEVANETGVDDIKHFSDIISIAKRTGGNLKQITTQASEKICNKIELSREIHTMIAAKQLESKIMNVIPFLIIIYLWLTSPGFMDGIYESAGGRLVMTGCLFICFLANYLSGKITDIKV